MIRRRLAALLCLTALLAGCSSDSSVGSQENLKFDEKGGNRVGGIDRPSPTPKRTSAAPVAPTRAAPRTVAPRPTAARPSPRPVAAAFTIKIVATGQGFDPFNFAVTKGTRVKVVNTDSQARTFTSDVAGQFDSGMLAPGKEFLYVADKPGAYNFHDETRPFAVGRMEVKG